MLNNRTTFMERLNDRVTTIETLLQKLEPIEGLLERLTLLEENIYTTKNVLTFMEACVYLGISESLLYKLTSSKEIPHYKPRGKMVYFEKKEIIKWIKTHHVIMSDESEESLESELNDSENNEEITQKEQR